MNRVEIPASRPPEIRSADTRLEVTPAVSDLVRKGIESGASDWHIDEGKTPALRVSGTLRMNTAAPNVTRADIESLLTRAGVPFASVEADAAILIGDELFRLSYGSSREGAGVVLRHVPNNCRTLEDLRVPPRFRELLDRGEGLVLVTGPTGSGKSTTLHAAVEYLNGRPDGGVVLILGDPVEYYHAEKRCRIRHREYGKDFSSWSGMLERSLRQDADVICISELRDPETMEMALAAAETGHLVLGTLHNGTAKDAVGRILDTCRDDDRTQQRAMLTKCLRGVLAQQLVPARSGSRVAAFELLVNTDGVSNLIRERRFGQMDDEILRGRQYGMIAMDESLRDLLQTGLITRETALRHARNPVGFESSLRCL